MYKINKQVTHYVKHYRNLAEINTVNGLQIGDVADLEVLNYQHTTAPATSANVLLWTGFIFYVITLCRFLNLPITNVQATGTVFAWLYC